MKVAGLSIIRRPRVWPNSRPDHCMEPNPSGHHSCEEGEGLMGGVMGHDRLGLRTAAVALCGGGAPPLLCVPLRGPPDPVWRRAGRVSASAIQTLFVSVHTATKLNQIWAFIRMY